MRTSPSSNLPARWCSVAPAGTAPSAALLLLRVIVGVAFVLHGWVKVQHATSWMPPEASMHIPAALQLLAAVAEFGGGLAWVLGFLTPVASVGIGITMGVAVHLHLVVLKDPFVNLTGGPSYELALVFLGIAVLFLALGPGRYSLDAALFGVRR